MQQYGSYFLTSFGYQIPVMIVWVVGLVFAISRWERHPQVSQLIVIALGIQFIVSILGIVSGILPIYLNSQLGLSYGEIGVYSGVLGLINLILRLASWVLLTIALFKERKPAHQPYQY